MRTEEEVLYQLAYCDETIAACEEKLKACHYSEIAFHVSTLAFAREDRKRLLWFLGKIA